MVRLDPEILPAESVQFVRLETVLLFVDFAVLETVLLFVEFAVLETVLLIVEFAVLETALLIVEFVPSFVLIVASVLGSVQFALHLAPEESALYFVDPVLQFALQSVLKLQYKRNYTLFAYTL